MNDFLQSLRGGQKDKRTPKTRRGFDNPQPYNSPSHYHHPQAGYHKQQHSNGKRPVRSPHFNPDVPEDQGVFLPSEIVESITSLIDMMAKNQEYLVDSQERRAAAEERKANALEDIAASMRFVADPPEQAGEEEEILASGDGFEEAFSTWEAAREPVLPDEDIFEEQEEPAGIALEKSQPEPAPVKKATPRAKTRRVGRPRKVDRPAAQTPEKEPVKVIKRKSRREKAEVTEGPLSRDEVMEKIHTMRENGKTFDEVAKFFVEIGQPTFSGRGDWHAQTVHRLCCKK